MKIRMTVITPVYQGVSFIEGCIQAVIGQYEPCIEHIIVDGGSNDGTVEVIEKYAGTYTHIRWISEKDRGQSHAMNKGISMARGDIINFLNVDDYYEPHALPQALSCFDKLKKPALLVGNCNIRDEFGEIVKVNTPSDLNRVRLLLCEVEFPFNPSAYFYHRSLHDVIGPYNEDEHYMMDLDFILRAVKVANVHYVDEIWGNHVRVKGSKTVELIESGMHADHYQRLFAAHIQQLGSIERQWLSTRQYLKRAVPRIYFYSTHRHKFMLAVKRKVRSLISSF